MASLSTVRALALRPSTRVLTPSRIASAALAQRRTMADSAANDHSKLTKAPPGESGPNMKQQEHVSEEAAKMAKITGGEGPDISQGTPVQEILGQEKDTRKNAPQVMKDEFKASKATPTKPSNSRSFSTMARRRLELSSSSSANAFGETFEPALVTNEADRARFELGNAPISSEDASLEQAMVGHKFPLPTLPLPPHAVKDKRHESVVDQFVGLIMEDGKKAKAQRYISVLLNTLRTNPAPTYDPKRALLPGAPPAAQLPLNPVLYLTLAIDSIAPLLRIRSQRGAAGGGVALQIPVPLRQRQRRRIAINWILEAVSKRKSRGSGKDTFPLRLAEEIVAIVEGRSAVWTKRQAVHRLATTARMNVGFGGPKRRR